LSLKKRTFHSGGDFRGGKVVIGKNGRQKQKVIIQEIIQDLTPYFLVLAQLKVATPSKGGI